MLEDAYVCRELSVPFQSVSLKWPNSSAVVVDMMPRTSIAVLHRRIAVSIDSSSLRIAGDLYSELSAAELRFGASNHIIPAIVARLG